MVERAAFRTAILSVTALGFALICWSEPNKTCRDASAVSTRIYPDIWHVECGPKEFRVHCVLFDQSRAVEVRHEEQLDLLSTERARCARLASEALTDALRASYAKEVDEIDSGVIASCKSHDPESLAVYLPVLEEKGMRHAGVIYRHQGLDKDICLLVASDDYYDEIDAAKVAMHLLAEMREFEPSEWEQVVRFRNGALKLGGGYADQLRFFFLMRAVAFPGQR